MSDAAFWNKIAEKYANRPIDDVAAYQQTLERVRARLAPGMAMLELGCGTGSTAIALSDAAATVLGTDISGEMVRIANDKARDLPHVTFAVADVAQAGAGQRFDMVTAFNLLHLLPERAQVLRTVRERLAPGGLFVSQTPCLGGKPWFRPLIWGLALFGKAPRTVNFLRPEQIEREICAAGFEIVETGDYPPKLPSRFVVARAV